MRKNTKKRPRTLASLRAEEILWETGFVAGCMAWLVCGCMVAEAGPKKWADALIALVLVSIGIRACYRNGMRAQARVEREQERLRRLMLRRKACRSGKSA